MMTVKEFHDYCMTVAPYPKLTSSVQRTLPVGGWQAMGLKEGAQAVEEGRTAPLLEEERV